MQGREGEEKEWVWSILCNNYGSYSWTWWRLSFLPTCLLLNFLLLDLHSQTHLFHLIYIYPYSLFCTPLSHPNDEPPSRLQLCFHLILVANRVLNESHPMLSLWYHYRTSLSVQMIYWCSRTCSSYHTSHCHCSAVCAQLCLKIK
jgi:hypothetical protein